jgi:hypothetical protein
MWLVMGRVKLRQAVSLSEHNAGSNCTYRRLVFVQDLIVLGHGDTENDRCYVFEAVDPFLSFRPLTAHIKQSVK